MSKAQVFWLAVGLAGQQSVPGPGALCARGRAPVFAFAQGAFLVVFMGDGGQMKGPYVL